MNILIADDELLARKRLRSMLEELLEDDCHIEEAENGQEVVNICEQMPMDVVLLDIRMPVLDGLKAAAIIMQQDKPPAIIFTTAFEEHALKAFETHAVAYLLKPIRQNKLQEALARACQLTRAQITALGLERQQPAFLSGSYRGGIQRVAVEDVIYFNAEQKYVVAHTSARDVLLEESLKVLEEKFPADFLRIHRNALVAKSRIISLEKNAEGHACVKLQQTDKKLEVSRRHLPRIRQFIREGSD